MRYTVDTLTDLEILNLHWKSSKTCVRWVVEVIFRYDSGAAPKLKWCDFIVREFWVREITLRLFTAVRFDKCHNQLSIVYTDIEIITKELNACY